VVIPTYNHARFLAAALRSVGEQSLRATEVIVVDDGSEDRPEEVVRDFPGVSIIHQANRGLAGARNTGLRASRSRYILFLDADDVLTKEALEAGAACFEKHPEAGFVYGAHRRIDAMGRAITPVRYTPIGAEPFATLLEGNCVGMHATVLYDREKLASIGGFDESLRYCEDYDVYLRLGRISPVASHAVLSAEYRWHGGNMSRNNRVMLNWVERVRDKHRSAALANESTARAYKTGRRVWRDYYAQECVEAASSAARLLPALIALAQAAWISPTATIGALGSRLRRKLRDAILRRDSPGLGRVRMGDLARTSPVCEDFGYNRGTPVDRRYIEDFLASHAPMIKGRALEIGDSAYCDRFGKADQQDILHIDANAPGVTIVGDLSQTGTLPTVSFDCLVITQTLHLIYDMAGAVRELHRALKPGGVALVTVPGITRIDRGNWRDIWFWSLTQNSAARLFGDVFGSANVTIQVYGNVYAATTFLQGLVLEEVDLKKLDRVDPCYPVIIAICARKAGRP
jgi:glycosyltransferase involved in cell wall biosynthesis